MSDETEPQDAVSPAIEAAKAEVHAALVDVGHAPWAARRVVEAVEAWIKAHLEPL